ncbi:MAG: metallophosphoesterase [Bacteroidales bacterium]|nr:metallophosphoesterase [Bacteroidales bacterium]
MKLNCVLAWLFLITGGPLAGQTAHRFMFLGDTHFSAPAVDLRSTLVYEFCMQAIQEEADFIFLAGDLVISPYSDPESEENELGNWRYLMDTLASHNIRLYACRGNNDALCGTYWDSLFQEGYQFPQNGPAGELNRSYALEFNNLLFISLDQYTQLYQVNQEWLDEVLAGASQDHIFVSGHTSAFKLRMTNTLINYPGKRDTLWESMTTARVKAYLCGHAHFYDHAVISDGDWNPDNNIHQYIVGTGRESFLEDDEYDGDNGRWTPERIYHDEAIGYLLVDIEGSDVNLTWKKRTAAFRFEEGGDHFRFSPDGNTDGLSQAIISVPRIYPNPASDQVQIELPTNIGGPVSLRLKDPSGRTVLQKILPPCHNYISLDLSVFLRGVYLLEVEYGGERIARSLSLL